MIRLDEFAHRFEGHRFFGSPVGTYLIELPDSILLVDLPDCTAANLDAVTSFGKPIDAVLTHGSCGIAAGTDWQRKARVRVYLHVRDRSNPWLAMTPDVLFAEDPGFDSAIRVIHTPGHTPGSVCVLDSRTGALFAGDTIGGTSRGTVREFRTGDPHNDDSEQRYRSVEALAAIDFSKVHPFHYEPLDGAAVRKFVGGGR